MSLKKIVNVFSRNKRNRQIFGPSFAMKVKILGGLILVIVLIALLLSVLKAREDIAGEDEFVEYEKEQEQLVEQDVEEPLKEEMIEEGKIPKLPELLKRPANKTKELDINNYSDQCQLAIRDKEKDIRASEDFRTRAYDDYEDEYNELVKEQEKLEEALEKVEHEKRKLELMVRNCDRGRLPY